MARMTGPDCAVMFNLINTHTHTYTHCSRDGNGDDDDGNENRIGEGGREAKKRKKPQNSFRNISIIDPPLGGSMRVA